MRLTISSKAQDDIDDHAFHIALDSPATAERFLAAAHETFEGLLEYPRKGTPRSFNNAKLTGLRSISLRGFPNHLAFYKADRRRVLIVRVVHGAMDLPRLFAPPRPRRRPP